MMPRRLVISLMTLGMLTIGVADCSSLKHFQNSSAVADAPIPNPPRDGHHTKSLIDPFDRAAVIESLDKVQAEIDLLQADIKARQAADHP